MRSGSRMNEMCGVAQLHALTQLSASSITVEYLLGKTLPEAFFLFTSNNFFSFFFLQNSCGNRRTQTKWNEDRCWKEKEKLSVGKCHVRSKGATCPTIYLNASSVRGCGYVTLQGYPLHSCKCWGMLYVRYSIVAGKTPPINSFPDLVKKSVLFSYCPYDDYIIYKQKRTWFHRLIHLCAYIVFLFDFFNFFIAHI